MSVIFINYRRDDSAGYAGRLYDYLAEHFSRDQIFMDVDHIQPGEDFAKTIEKKLSTAKAAIVLIGRQWMNITDSSGLKRLDNTDDYVRLEIETLLKQNILVIPVLVGGAALPKASELPNSITQLATLNALELGDGHRFRSDARKLIETIGKVLVNSGLSISINKTTSNDKTALTLSPFTWRPRSDIGTAGLIIVLAYILFQHIEENKFAFGILNLSLIFLFITSIRYTLYLYNIRTRNMERNANITPSSKPIFGILSWLTPIIASLLLILSLTLSPPPESTGEFMDYSGIGHAAAYMFVTVIAALLFIIICSLIGILRRERFKWLSYASLLAVGLTVIFFLYDSYFHTLIYSPVLTKETTITLMKNYVDEELNQNSSYQKISFSQEGWKQAIINGLVEKDTTSRVNRTMFGTSNTYHFTPKALSLLKNDTFYENAIIEESSFLTTTREFLIKDSKNWKMSSDFEVKTYQLTDGTWSKEIESWITLKDPSLNVLAEYLYMKKRLVMTLIWNGDEWIKENKKTN